MGQRKRKCFQKVCLSSFSVLFCSSSLSLSLLPVLINLWSCWGKKIDTVRPSKANNLLLFHFTFFSFLLLQPRSFEGEQENKMRKLRKRLTARKFFMTLECRKSINSITDFEEILMASFLKSESVHLDKWLWRVYVKISFTTFSILRKAIKVHGRNDVWSAKWLLKHCTKNFKFESKHFYCWIIIIWYHLMSLSTPTAISSCKYFGNLR